MCEPKLEVFCLHTWTVSGNPCAAKAFLQRIVSCLYIEVPLHSQSILVWWVIEWDFDPLFAVNNLAEYFLALVQKFRH